MRFVRYKLAILGPRGRSGKPLYRLCLWPRLQLQMSALTLCRASAVFSLLHSTCSPIQVCPSSRSVRPRCRPGGHDRVFCRGTSDIGSIPSWSVEYHVLVLLPDLGRDGLCQSLRALRPAGSQPKKFSPAAGSAHASHPNRDVSITAWAFPRAILYDANSHRKSHLAWTAQAHV